MLRFSGALFSTYWNVLFSTYSRLPWLGREVNDFQLIQSWLGQCPSIVYVLFMGAVSDHFGRKIIILIPLVGEKLL